MDLFAAINPLLVVSGFVVGMLVGLTGVGGGSLMTPILVLLFGVHATTAVGTDLLYAAITKTGGTLTHGLKGTVDWRVTGRLAAGSIPATILTLFGLYILGIKGNDLYGAFPVKRLFLGFAHRSLFGAGKAVLHPVACDQVSGARGRGQGTETLA